MSCASPIPQLSPPSLHMYTATLLSPCKSPLDDADPLHLHSPFSFSFSAAARHSLSSSPLSSSPAASRSALTDIRLQRHKNSPLSPQLPLSKSTKVADAPCLSSPRKGCKENWETAGKIQRNDVETGGRSDAFFSSSNPSPFKNRLTGKVWRSDLGNGATVEALSPSPASPSLFKNKSAGKGWRSDAENAAAVEAVNPSPSPSPFKRKRPAKLAIPEIARLASFGKAKGFALSEQEPVIQSYETALFAVSCRRGRKDCMEDAHTAITNFHGKANQAFFGVFDGHGGNAAAQFAAENLSRHIEMALQSEIGGKKTLKDAMQAGYLATDAEFLAKGMKSGACSISAFVKEGQLVIANAGDCKAVLCRDGQAEALSDLHRASNIKERQRIESLGGYVDCFNGIWRVQGTLAITRAFGDINFKQWVSADPEVRQLNITHDCEFLILASDGLWDKVSDQEAVDCARELLRNLGEKDETLDSPVSRPSKAPRHHFSSTPSSTNGKNTGETASGKKDACDKLIHKACNRGNLDDITVLIIPLKNFATPR